MDSKWTPLARPVPLWELMEVIEIGEEIRWDREPLAIPEGIGESPVGIVFLDDAGASHLIGNLTERGWRQCSCYGCPEMTVVAWRRVYP